MLEKISYFLCKMKLLITNVMPCQNVWTKPIQTFSSLLPRAYVYNPFSHNFYVFLLPTECGQRLFQSMLDKYDPLEGTLGIGIKNIRRKHE
jgi:hypothetical protein